jgi:hypothetical protein
LHVAVAGRAAQSRIVRSAVLIGCGAVISENPAGHRVIGSVTVAGRRGSCRRGRGVLRFEFPLIFELVEQ